FFKKSTGKLEALKARYEKAEGKVDEIVDILTKHQVQLIQDAAMLDQMYQLNQTYFKELSMYILAGKKKVDKARQTELETLRQKAIASGTQEDAQAVSDYSSMIERFEKKVHDLELTRMVALQMAPQIRMVQSNDTVMAEKIQSTIVNTIPLWKNQMVIAMGENHSAQAAKAQKEVTDMTNQLLLSNAQKLKQTTVDIRRESERGIVDIETLRQTNGILIDTMNEILKIQQEGREQRRQAQAQLAQMEQQMKEKLLEISK
ncbi:MAG: toxic anion resistance protein, partial [Lachnospiraceae bacterium]